MHEDESPNFGAQIIQMLCATYPRIIHNVVDKGLPRRELGDGVENDIPGMGLFVFFPYQGVPVSGDDPPSDIETKR